jgi:hypothetical protein
MNIRSIPPILTLSAAIVINAQAAAQPRPVPIDVQSGTAVDVVLVKQGNPDKVLTTTDANGKGAVDVTELLNLGKLAVIEETCDRTRILLVAKGGHTSNDKNCRKRRVGAFWPGRDAALTVNRSGGMSTAARAGVIGGVAGAGAIAVAVAATRTSNTAPASSTGPTTNLTAFNGTYAGVLTATANSCALPGLMTISGTLSVDSSGHGSWQGADGLGSFNLTSSLSATSPSTASFTATGTQQVGSQAYSVSAQATISGSTATVVVTVTPTNGSSCTTTYNGQLSKS